MLMASSKIILFHLYAICFFLLSYHVVARAGDDASPFSFSFDFSNRSTTHSDDLLFRGNASLDGGLVDLTRNSSFAQCNNNCTWELWYKYMMPFYDSTSGEVASFVTWFTFAIKADKLWGGGMAFLLAEYIPPNSSYLSLHNDGPPFVAVVFDTLKNTSDKEEISHHMGIVINSAAINSVASTVNTTSLPNLGLNGSMTASITYNGSTNMLIASLQFDDHPSLEPVQVSTLLTRPGSRVTASLPSKLGVGFTAATSGSVELHQIMSWSFNSTLSWSVGRTYKPRKTGVPKHVLYAALTHGPYLLVVILAVVIWFGMACYKHIHQGDSFVKGAGDLAKRFEYRELAAATDKFSKSKELGQGAFGVVYEGKLTDRDGLQHQVAVKKIKGSNGEGEDFLAELKTISETRHKNLVRLKGWCTRNRSNLVDFICWGREKRSVELFLVYELVPNGNLDVHLNKKEQVLPWAMRYNIVKDIGSALRYLHHECNKCILHRDIKPGNILLDEQFNAKLADFGLSRIAHRKNEAVLTTASEMLAADLNANTVVLTKANGTVAYMDLNCMKDGIVSTNRRSDVYSFGIVLLEIPCTGKTRTEVWDIYKRDPENLAATADARLNGDFDVAQMQHVAVLGLWCSFPDDARRPSMLQAMEVLEHDAPLPNLIKYVKLDAQKIWHHSRAILSYVKLNQASDTNPVLFG